MTYTALYGLLDVAPGWLDRTKEKAPYNYGAFSLVGAVGLEPTTNQL